MKNYLVQKLKKFLGKFKIYITRASIPPYLGMFGWKIGFGFSYPSSTLCIKVIEEFFKKKLKFLIQCPIITVDNSP